MVNYHCKAFNELTPSELYMIIAARVEVFVVEQNCPYQDLDYKDQQSFHILGMSDDKLYSYTRIMDKGVSYPDHCSIGRVLTTQAGRGKGIGKHLMQYSLEKCKELFDAPIKISAQCYLEKFYQNLGFEIKGEQYLEDDIPHQAMVLSTN